MTEERSQSALFGAVSKELLAGGMGFRFQARGRSMAPSIWDGDIVHVQPVAVETLCKGDIVLFSDGARFLAHRLVKAGPGALVTQGDAALERDSLVRPEQILGKVVAKEENADGVTRVVKLGAAPARRYRARRAFAGLASRVSGRLSELENRLFGRGISRLLKLLVVLFAIALALPAWGQVAFNSTNEASARLTGIAPSVTVTGTLASGTNSLLLVGVSLNISGNTTANVSGITYNGTPLTFVGANNDAANSQRVEIWSLIGPAAGSYNIVANFFLPGGSGTVGAVVGANFFNGVDQHQPLRTFVSSSGEAGAYSMLDIPSGINEYAMDVLSAAGSVTISGYATAEGTVPDTMEWIVSTGGNATDVSGSSATHAGTTSIPMAENFSGTSNWSVAGISVKPVQSDVGVSVTSTSALYPANLTYNVTVTNYGPTPATNVTLTDTLATGLTNVQFSSSQVSCSGTYPTYTCAVGNLATNASIQVVVTATPSASGTYTNTASVTASQTDYNTLNNSYTAIASSQQTSCAISTAPPAGGTLTGVINTYFPGNGSVAAAATSIPVLAATSGGGAGIASGDLLLVIQMQGASMNDSNTSAYGNGASGAGYTNLNNTGNYEYVTATSAYGSGAGSIPIKGAGPGGGLLFSYISSAATATQGQFTFQVVRVPQYSTATLSSTLTALAWNGSTGGILAVDIAGTLTLGSATVVLDGFGFRGAAGLQLTGAGTASDDYDYVYTSPATYTGVTEAGAQGGKAEGIAGTPAWVNSGSPNYYLNTGTDYPDGTTGAANGGRARGAPGNAGGGGTDGDAPNNDDNSGGGGGGNGGGGGAGGDSWDSTLGVGGLGGSAFPANINRVVMGGGGGSGTRNNSPGDNQASSGSAGGGIVMIRAGGLSGSATITANGLASYNGTSNDAGGGGGGGGSIIVLSSSGGESGLTISAQGGTGGNAWSSQGFTLQNRHGPGGGGGGGVVLLSGAAASVNVSGAANGLTLNSPAVPYGATSGFSGIYVSNASLAQDFGIPGGLQCLPDLAITKSHSGAFVAGSTGSYSIVVSNVSAYGATVGTVTMSDTLPTGLTPTSASGTNWTCSVTGQTVSCTRSDALSAGASYPAITVNASVSPSAPSSVTNTATVSGGGEVNLSNDSASNLTYIVAASTGTANLSITTTATSGTWVYAGNNLTFVHTITNSGPAVSDITFTEAVPAYSTFQYVTVPAGWTCTTPAVGATGTVSCTNPSVAVNSPITITVAFNTNSTTTNGTYITATASVAAATTYDPNLANNTASVTTLVNTGVNLTVTNTGTPSPVLTGGKITYTQTVVNNGPSAAPTVVFTEVIPPNGDPATSTFSSMGALPAGWSCSSIPTSGKAGTITCSVSSMAPGNTAIFTVVLNATGAGGTVVTDVASAYPTPTTLETSPGDNSATSTINVDAANTADLGVAISGPANPIVAGTNITYTYTVTNYGPAIVTNATLTGATPANTTLVSYTAPTGWTCTTSCSLNSGNTLAVNATAIFTMVVTVTITDTPGTTVTPSATVSTTMTDPNSANNTATLTNTVGAQADLAITNTSTPPTLTPSNNITYTQQLTNNGPNTITANTANGVTYTVTIQIPTNTNFQSITVPRHWTCVPPAVGTVGPTTFPCTLSSGSSLASNASVTFSPVLQVSATAANGTIISETASVASCSSAACSDPVSTNNSATVSNTVVTSTTEADLVVTNTPSVTSVSAGEPITYTQVLTNNGPANASTVTFTEAIPTNTNFQAITATGWTCTTPAVGATGTVTCKIATLNNAAAETFLLTVQVNAGTAAGTIITDAASATATTTDPNSSNNTNITATTTVAATGNADMSVSMTGTPSTVNQGDTLTYTISVSNNGPNQATNVTLTDALPSGVTYASVSTTAGTCSQASGTVTCLLGTMSNGGSATVTLLASAGSSATITNTASVTAAQNDPNLSNNSSSVTTTIATPTAVKLRWFKAVYSGSDVILQWKTGGEAHNLGFNVYREQNGERVRINPSLVAGSALRMHDTSSAHSAKTYAWMDHPPANASGVYWLEDVDLNGVRTFHGPSYVQAESGVQVVSRARMITELRTTNTSLGAAASRGLTGSSFNPAPSTTEQQQIQFALAAGPAMKIQVRQEGWYQITQAQVAAAGLNVAQLGGARLYAEGVEQPIRVSGSAAGGGMRSELEFYGTGIDTVSSNARVYWLVVNGGSGKRIHQLSGAGGGGARPQSFPYTVELKDRTTYFAALPTSDGNNFFGALVTTTPVDQVLAVQDVVTAAAEPVQLEVALQGVVADVAHDVQVSLNGVTVGDITYNGQNQGTLNIEVPVNLLVAGNNTVTLTAQDGDNDISLVGHITLTYPHSYTAQSDYLKFSAVSGDHIKVQGFTQAPSRLLDITDPANPVEVMARVVAQTAGFALDFSVPAELSGTRTFLAVADDAMASPVALVYNQPSNWHASQAGAQVVMISDPAFASQLTPLVSLRQSQGWSVAVVLTDDIFDEFNFGERSPQAIRDFLQNSTTQWQTQPQYVLLVGDASVDPNNYLGFGYFDFVPTKIIATSELMTACDDWFTEFGNDGIAQIPTGRLPVSTADQATLVVGKIVGYETNATFAPWMNAALLVADQDDTESFTKDTLSVAALLPQSMQLTEVMASTMDPGTASQQILAAINSGKLLVNYLGHGSEGQWSGEDLFDDDAAASLTNSNQLSVFLLMDCLNGFFHDVYAESLATALLFSPNGGAVAVWASSGLVNPAPEVQMDQQLISALVANPGVALGDAVQQGKMNITDPGARQTYILFGDPLLHMKSMSAATVPARQPHRPVPVRQPLQ